MKKCVLCANKAVFTIKDTSEFYCEDCALENFSDIGSLTRIEDEKKAQKPQDPTLQEEFEDI